VVSQRLSDRATSLSALEQPESDRSALLYSRSIRLETCFRGGTVFSVLCRVFAHLSSLKRIDFILSFCCELVTIKVEFFGCDERGSGGWDLGCDRLDLHLDFHADTGQQGNQLLDREFGNFTVE
jgi:hypothetical protein